MRPPGYEPGELPTAPLRDIFFLSSQILCKGTTYFCIQQIFMLFSCTLPQKGKICQGEIIFLHFFLANSNKIDNFAHDLINVQ